MSAVGQERMECCCWRLECGKEERRRRRMKISAPITLREAVAAHEQDDAIYAECGPTITNGTGRRARSGSPSTMSGGLRFRYISNLQPSSDPSVVGEIREIELQLVCDRIMTMTFPTDGSDLSYTRSLKDVSQMLKRQYKENYQIINLSEKRSDLTRLNGRVLDFGTPPLVVSPVATLVLACRQVMQWLRSNQHHVAVFHCKGDQARLATFIAAYMSFCASNSRPSEAVVKEKLALKQLFDRQMSKNCTPSHRRYLQLFSGTLSGRLALHSGPKRALTLHSITLAGLHKFFATGLCAGKAAKSSAPRIRLFLKIYQNMRLTHSTPVYAVANPKDRIRFAIEPPVSLSGDVLVKCFFKMAPNASRETLFRLQFNSEAVPTEKVFFFKDELDVACNNSKFPTNARIDLLFKPSATVTKEFEKAVSLGRLGIDRTQDPIVRWDSYADFHNANVYTSLDYIDSAGRLHGPMNTEHSSRLSAIQHTAGPVDGSPYAEVVRDTLISSSVRNTATNSHSSPAWQLTSQDSGFSSTPGSATAKLRSVSGGAAAGLSASDARELDRLLEELRVAGETAVTSVQRSQPVVTSVRAEAANAPLPVSTYRTSLTRMHQQLAAPSASSASAAAARRDQLGYESEPEGPAPIRLGESSSDREARLLSELRDAKAQLENLRRQKEGEVFDINLRYSQEGARRRHRSQQDGAFVDPPVYRTQVRSASVEPQRVPAVSDQYLHQNSRHLLSSGSLRDPDPYDETDTTLADLERTLQAASDKIFRERMSSTYSAHRENQKLHQHHTHQHPHQHVHQHHVSKKKEEGPGEIYEEIETVTLQPIGKGVHDLEGSSGIGRTMSGVQAPRYNYFARRGYHTNGTQSMDRLHQVGDQYFQQSFSNNTSMPQRAKTPQPRDMTSGTLQSSNRRRHYSHEFVNSTSATDMRLPSFEVTPPNGFATTQHLQHAQFWNNGQKIPVQNVPVDVHTPPAAVAGGTLGRERSGGYMYQVQRQPQMAKQQQFQHQVTSTISRQQPMQENAFSNATYQQQNFGRQQQEQAFQSQTMPLQRVQQQQQEHLVSVSSQPSPQQRVQQQQQEHFISMNSQPAPQQRIQQQQQEHFISMNSQPAPQQRIQQQQQEHFISMNSQPAPQQRVQQQQQEHFISMNSQPAPQQRIQQQQQEHLITMNSQSSPQQRVQQQQQEHFISMNSQPAPQQRIQQQQQEHLITMNSQPSAQQKAQQQQQEHFITMNSPQSPQQRIQQQQQEHVITMNSQTLPQQRGQQQQEHFISVSSQPLPQQKEHFISLSNQQATQPVLSRHIQQQQFQEPVFSSNAAASNYQTASAFQQQINSKTSHQQMQEQQLLHTMLNQSSPQASASFSTQASWSGAEVVDGGGSTPKFVRDTTKLWYKPNISRDEAIRHLRTKPPGSFVVRDSNSFPGAFGLAVKVAQVPQNITPKSDDLESELVRHFLIEPTSKGVRLKGCANEPVFGSLTALIYQHTVTALALPCRLVIPMATGEMGMDMAGFGSASGTFIRGSSGANSDQWTVLFLGTVEVESMTGSNAVVRSIDTLMDEFHPGRQTTECQLKLSADGVTLTDTQRKLFFRRHYQPSAVSFCGIDPKDRSWSSPELTARNIKSSRLFGLITRKQSQSLVTDNLCHVFCELTPVHSAANIVASVNRYLSR